MRILYVVLGGVALYVLMAFSAQSLKTYYASDDSAVVATAQPSENFGQIVVASAEESTTTDPTISTEILGSSEELRALSIELSSQAAAVGRNFNKRVPRSTTTPVVTIISTTSVATSSPVATSTKPVVSTSCTVGSTIISTGQSKLFYSATTVTAPLTCLSVSLSRTCTNGILSGSSLYQYSACSVVMPAVSTPPVSSASSSPISVPLPTPVIAKKQWGAFVGGSYTASALTAFETQVGSPVNMQAVFVGWGSGSGDFPTQLAAPLKGAGKTLVIFWEPSVDLDAVASGSWDMYMKSFAASVKSYGGPVIIAPFHEMNGNWDVWDGLVGTNNSAKLIVAWKHMHGLFSAAGVTNVKWGWAVNNESVPDTVANKFENYYPGSDYVDVVGVDGFNFGTPWQSFDQVFGSALQRLSVYGKPIYIFSFASAAGSQKSAWITDALTVQMYKYPLISGWIWFNENKEQNWLISSDAATLAAFQAAVK